MPKMSCCGYERALYHAETLDLVVSYLSQSLIHRMDQFDAIAVSGYSMTIPGSIVAWKMQKHIIAIRKDSEQRNSGYSQEGLCGQRCVIVDDLVSSGKSMKRVIDGVAALGGTVVGYLTYNAFSSDPFEYNDLEVPCWTDTDKVRVLNDSVHGLFKLRGVEER